MIFFLIHLDKKAFAKSIWFWLDRRPNNFEKQEGARNKLNVKTKNNKKNFFSRIVFSSFVFTGKRLLNLNCFFFKLVVIRNNFIEFFELKKMKIQ